MNEQLIALSHDNLIQLCLLRREDVRAAMKEATKIFYKEDPAYKAKMAEYHRNWYLKNKSRHLENSKRWHERNKEKVRLYRREHYERQKAAAAANLPKRRTDTTDLVKYWNDRIAEYDRRFSNKEIDVEEWSQSVSCAVIHRDAAERRMKSKKTLNNEHNGD